MKKWFTTARLTGLFYLGLAITGVFAFLFAREKIFVDGDTLATATNLVDKETLARWGIAAEVGITGFQALVAVWFFKLFRKKESFAAGLIAAFGLINAVAILVASAFWLSALHAAGSDASTAYTLFDLHESMWMVSSLFFGLWLLPMAYAARKTKMPYGLAFFLMLGGVGYVLATFTGIVLPNNTALTEALPMPATIGEFWMIGYLLIKPIKA